MLIVGIAGGTGSGKTTVVKKVMEVFSNDEVIVITLDSYYRDNSDISLEERRKISFDHPDSVEWRLLTDHLKHLKKRTPVEIEVLI
jgi:uridine kinase